MKGARREVRERALEIGQRRSSVAIYFGLHRLVRCTLHPWLRLSVQNQGVLDLGGPMILAPVHRSHLDGLLVATLSRRRVRSLGKESLFGSRLLCWISAVLGMVPIDRGGADRGALLSAKRLLEEGSCLIVFPEGRRLSGEKVGELYDGVAWLALKTGAPVVPIGVAGTEEALPKNSRWVRRSRVAIVVGHAVRIGEVSGVEHEPRRARLSKFTAIVASELQSLQSSAVLSRCD